MLSDTELIRYQRQVALPEIGERGQLKLNLAKVLIIGAGGLGNPVAMYLAAAGIGSMVIADGDCVELSNLQRQVSFSHDQVGSNKAQSLANNVKRTNPLVRTRAVRTMLEGQRLYLEVMMADVVLDCSDNFETRFKVNQACVVSKTPLVSASSVGWKGQLVVLPNQGLNPCYQCLVPETPKQTTNCISQGIVGPVVATLGCYQALAAMRFLLDVGKQENTVTLHLFDGLTMSWQQLKFEKNTVCPICNTNNN